MDKGTKTGANWDTGMKTSTSKWLLSLERDLDLSPSLIPIQFRILVEGSCSKDHPALQDLMPSNGNTQEKILLNRLGCGTEDFLWISLFACG
jgi:hypothetical protein